MSEHGLLRVTPTRGYWAFLYTGTNLDALLAMFRFNPAPRLVSAATRREGRAAKFKAVPAGFHVMRTAIVPTATGDVLLRPNHWVVKHPDGVFEVLDGPEFARDFYRIPDPATEEET